MLDFKELDAFVWAVKLGSFRKAAVRLHITQPSISERISRLESTVGELLLERSARPIQPTMRGREFFLHPQTILAYSLNGQALPVGNGAPLRLRVERQCGYKNLKFLKSIQVVDSMASFGRGTGGINSDWGFHWFGGV